MKLLASLLLAVGLSGCANALPAVVAHRSFLNRTGDISAITLFTPAVAGEYRISIYLESLTGAGANISAVVCGTDDTPFSSCADTNLSPGPASEITRVIHSPANKPFVFGVGAAGNTIPYSVFVVIERIN